MIKYLKLSNGEEYIATVEDDQLEFITDKLLLTKVFRIGQNNKGEIGIAPCFAKEFTVNRHAIMCEGEPIDDLANAYRSLVGGIQVAGVSALNRLQQGNGRPT
jgi:hypothetical protein